MTKLKQEREGEKSKEKKNTGGRIIRLSMMCLPPISMTITVNTFSPFVLADTFPNPTVVILVSVKYSAVMYAEPLFGPPPLTEKFPYDISMVSPS